MKLKLMTYNIRGARGMDGRRDLGRIGSFLATQKVDIVLIQEFDTLSSESDTDEDIAALQTQWLKSFIAAPTIMGPHGWYGNAILSRFPITRHSVTDISHTGREPRNILEAFVETPSGPLHIMNTHKGLSYRERSRQMAKLNELLHRKSEVPLIVGGDINEWHVFSGGLKKLNLTLRAIPTKPTFPTLMPLLQLDRIWCRPHNLVTNLSVLKTKETRVFSDHYPLLAELEL